MDNLGRVTLRSVVIPRQAPRRRCCALLRRGTSPRAALDRTAVVRGRTTAHTGTIAVRQRGAARIRAIAVRTAVSRVRTGVLSTTSVANPAMFGGKIRCHSSKILPRCPAKP
ncbi:hypothetical protein ACFORO_40895 [Amycolatopsis halotolerans]|uniref:Uncharacterized protein n=1 Tax=Amycolatopsis halotolerans TaxID=330083 RepID=A0ABV7QU53_9PSEU